MSFCSGGQPLSKCKTICNVLWSSLYTYIYIYCIIKYIYVCMYVYTFIVLHCLICVVRFVCVCVCRLGGSQSDSNHHSSDNSELLSPRKKPRKQNMWVSGQCVRVSVCADVYMCVCVVHTDVQYAQVSIKHDSLCLHGWSWPLGYSHIPDHILLVCIHSWSEVAFFWMNDNTYVFVGKLISFLGEIFPFKCVYVIAPNIADGISMTLEDRCASRVGAE